MVFRPLYGVAAGAAALLAAVFLAGAGSEANAAAQVVKSGMGYSAGTIVVVNNERKLYLMLGGGKALRYPVAIGKPSQVWTGTSRVSKKAKNPSWLNPDDPTATRVEGGPTAPLGVRALYLGSTLYRIHGTPKKNSIGYNVSNGCIRMTNADVTHLYNKVPVGAKVVAINSKSSAPRAGAPKPVNMALYLRDKAKSKRLAAIKLKRARRLAG